MSKDPKKLSDSSSKGSTVELNRISRSQAGVRHQADALARLRDWMTKNPGRLPEPVVLNRFEDGTFYLRDGHGRLAVAEELGMAVLKEGRDFVLETYTYADYATTELDEGWVTPFDPRIHLRLAELSGYKKLITVLRTLGASDTGLRGFIEMHPEAYRVDRAEKGDASHAPSTDNPAIQHIPRSKNPYSVVEGLGCAERAHALALSSPDSVIVGSLSGLPSVRQAQRHYSAPNLVYLQDAEKGWPLSTFSRV